MFRGKGTAMKLYRYVCDDCKTKSFLPDYKDNWTLCCPACGMQAVRYDRPVELVMVKGSSNRKMKYLALYIGEEGEFYIDGRTNEFVAPKDIITGKSAYAQKNIQYFGIKR
jgi:predicted nucleic acid-binding Zn ribbon protein